jgi:hypothetical protein
MPGERAEQLDVRLGVIDLLPAVLADPGHLEQPAGLDPGPLVGQFPRPRPGRSERQPLVDLVVDVLDLPEERIAAGGEHVLGRPQGQVPAGPQRRPGPLIAHGRVHPVPRCGREHQAGRLLWPPVLEPFLDHRDRPAGQVAPRRGGQLAAQLHARDPEPPPGQRQRGLAGRAADLEQPVAGLQPGHGHEVVVQGFGIVRTRPVVALRGPVERLPQPLAFLIRPHPGSIPHIIATQNPSPRPRPAPPCPRPVPPRPAASSPAALRSRAGFS